MNQAIHKKLLDQTMADYTFRVATPDDVDGIVALWPEHWAEAHYRDRGIVPDEERYRKWTWTMLEYGAGVWLLALHDDRIIGFFAYTLDHNFSEKPVAVMGTFFVEKAHRRSAVPAVLFELGIGLAEEDGACALHAPITSETRSSRALENMFTKHNFKQIGVMMGRAL
jgi:GNAT superfamily N-acetyltransferase